MSEYPALDVKSPDVGATLGTIFGLKSKQIGIEQQRQALQGQAAQVQQEQQDASQRQAVGKFYNSFKPDEHVGSDGTLDLDSALQDKNLDAAGDAKPAVIESLMNIKKSQLGNKQVLANLNKGLVDQFGTTIGSLANDPDVQNDSPNGRAKVDSAIQNFGQLSPDAARVAQIYGPVTTHAPQGKLGKAVGAIQLQAQSASEQQAQQNPQTRTQDQGDVLQNQNVDKATGAVTNVGQPVRKGIPPGYTVINGQVVRADNAGLSLPNSRSAPGAAPPAETPGTGPKLEGMKPPPLNANPGDVARYNNTMDENRKHIADVSAGANDLQNGVGPTRYRNDQIQDILNSQTYSATGPGAAQLNWIASKLPGSSGDAFQKINHYLAQNSAAIAQKMGVPHTNEGAEQASSAAGSSSQNRGALLEVTKVNDAMNTALDMYNRGLAKVSKNGADPSKVSAYRQAFGQNFDMNALRYDDALRRGDKPEIDGIVKQLGPTGLKALGQKRKILHSLSDTGDLP